jgi:hypothetical protein
VEKEKGKKQQKLPVHVSKREVLGMPTGWHGQARSEYAGQSLS